MKSWWAPVRSGLILDPKHRKKIGQAVWLLHYFFMYADRGSGKLNRRVQTITNELDVKVRTIESWLTILRRGGYIKTRRLSNGLVIEIQKWRSLKNASAPAEKCGKGEVAPAESKGVIRNIMSSDPQNPALVLENHYDLSNGKNSGEIDQSAEKCGIKKSLLKDSFKDTPPNPPTGGIDFLKSDSKKKWAAVKEHIKVGMLPENFKTWIDPTVGLIFLPNKMVVGVPNRFFVKCLEMNYRSEIQEALIQAVGFNPPPVPEFEIMST